MGIHILICSALYVDASGEKKYFRKFFKFQVSLTLTLTLTLTSSRCRAAG